MFGTISNYLGQSPTALASGPAQARLMDYALDQLMRLATSQHRYRPRHVLKIVLVLLKDPAQLRLNHVGRFRSIGGIPSALALGNQALAWGKVIGKITYPDNVRHPEDSHTLKEECWR